MMYMSELEHLKFAREIMIHYGVETEQIDLLIADLQRQEDESDVCPSCHGRGSYEALQENYQGRVIGSGYQKCWTCNGTGKKLEKQQ